MEKAIETKNKKKITLAQFLWAVILSAELCLTADLVAAWNDHPITLPVIAGSFALVLLLLSLLQCRLKQPVIRILSLTVAGIFIVSVAAAGAIWYAFYRNDGYMEADPTASASAGSFFRNKNVMLIVPHQDDDLNLLGGVFEEYIAGGSTVRVVFTTNGDYRDLGELRINEALDVLTSCGIPEENVIFLGYGDGWKDVHLYNTTGDEVQTSYAGYTATYGTETHPAWDNGTPYTSGNFLEDLQDVIEEFMPDVICCVDYDGHPDHKAASMFFERAMGRIRKIYPEYVPLVLKGFAYPTAYYAPKDFYRLNILSTVNLYGEEYVTQTNIYRWDDRIRIPVAVSSLSRSILNADVYRKTCLYASQSARFQATGMINGDKVFWLRDTSSLTYGAAVAATSGEAERLNDFMLEECVNVNQDGRQPFDGIWTPYADDAEKTATLTFDTPTVIDRICLYDNPSVWDNVLNAELILYPEDGVTDKNRTAAENQGALDDQNGAEDNNTAECDETPEPIRLETGPLHAGGEATEFTFDPVSVRSISVRLLETEGQGAGLGELEAYCGREDYSMKILKLCDNNGDFVYDYIYSGTDTETFRLYALNSSENISDYIITCTDPSSCNMSSEEQAASASESCEATVNADGTVTVCVPKGEQCILTVSASDGSVSDSVLLRNNGILMKLGQSVESFVYYGYEKFQTTAVYTLVKAVFHIFSADSVTM